MKIKFDIKKNERKAFVKEIGEILKVKPEYQGAPSFAYKIGAYIIDKDGVITSETSDAETDTQLTDRLIQAGYKEMAAKESCGMVIQIPLDGFDETGIENLNALVTAKQALIQKSLGMEYLPKVKRSEMTLDFPWFPEPTCPEEIEAYTNLVEALSREAKKLKRVTAKPHEFENEKYAFRTFLLRLGFVGDRYKSTRKILLRNLSGSSAFRNGKAGE